MQEKGKIRTGYRNKASSIKGTGYKDSSRAGWIWQQAWQSKRMRVAIVEMGLKMVVKAKKYYC